VKENNTEGVHEPRTLDTSVREPYGIAERVVVQVFSSSVQNTSPCQGIVSGFCEVADQRLFWSENEDNLILLVQGIEDIPKPNSVILQINILLKT
jgi:hypothetical protein